MPTVPSRFEDCSLCDQGSSDYEAQRTLFSVCQIIGQFDEDVCTNIYYSNWFNESTSTDAYYGFLNYDFGEDSVDGVTFNYCGIYPWYAETADTWPFAPLTYNGDWYETCDNLYVAAGESSSGRFSSDMDFSTLESGIYSYIHTVTCGNEWDTGDFGYVNENDGWGVPAETFCNTQNTSGMYPYVQLFGEQCCTSGKTICDAYIYP